MQKPYPIPSKAKKIIHVLLEHGAADCLLVGGFVRDCLLGLPPKEVDIEVYGLAYDQIVDILRRKRFRVGLVGKSFGVVKVDNDIDLSIPRLESKQGSGHKGFHVTSDPNLAYGQAFARRDFTINAIGMRLSGDLIDPFGGQADMRQKLLRAPTEAFCEDPLRVLRAMQFAGRFGFDLEPHTIELCRSVLPEFGTLSPERVWGEWYKWATRSQFPAKGLRVLEQTGWIACFPEIAALIGVPQHPARHPEGDVFAHTCLVCDAAKKITDEMRSNEIPCDEREQAILLFAALCHDFGKPATTTKNQHGEWSAPNHAAESVTPATTFLERMLAPGWLLEQVTPLVAEHLAHLIAPDADVPQDQYIRRLADRLTPSNIRLWAALCRADSLGCGFATPWGRINRWEAVAEKLRVRESRPKPILQGRDLIARGMAPGPEMGRLLQRAYESQLDGVFTDHDSAMQWLTEREPATVPPGVAETI